MVEDRYDLDAIREKVGHELVRRGDSFDIGELAKSSQEQDIIVKIMQNPSQLQELLNIDEAQAENIKAVLTGAGAGLASKYLAKHFGDAVAGGFGGFVGGIIAQKLLGK